MATNQALPSLKTVVLVKDLIAAIERTRDREVKAEQAEVDAYPAKRKAYIAALKAFAKKRVAEIDEGFDATRRGYWDLGNWFENGAPQRPDKPGKGCAKTKYDALLAQLRLTTDVKVKISPSDFAKYMAGDESACKC